MKPQDSMPRTKPKHLRPSRRVSRLRAASIARSRLAAVLIACDVSEELPAGATFCTCRPLPKDCWYVVCRPRRTNMVGGTSTLVCISRRSGRVLMAKDLQSE